MPFDSLSSREGSSAARPDPLLQGLDVSPDGYTREILIFLIHQGPEVSNHASKELTLPCANAIQESAAP